MRCIIVGYGVQGKKRLAVAAKEAAGVVDPIWPEARWKELGLPEFANALTGITCTDHNGHQSAYLQQWDGDKWIVASDWINPMKERVRPMLEAAAKDYVSKDPAWPKRTEPCDKSS